VFNDLFPSSVRLLLLIKNLLPSSGRCSVVCFRGCCLGTNAVSQPLPSNDSFSDSTVLALSVFIYTDYVASNMWTTCEWEGIRGYEALKCLEFLSRSVPRIIVYASCPVFEARNRSTGHSVPTFGGRVSLFLLTFTFHSCKKF
jgi:hypothetical protein